MKGTNGFLIVNKHKGCTSHDCVKEIRKLFKTKKVGHTGTLDPQVTGILPIALGHATKFIQYLPQEKSYSGIIKLGIQTNTDDIHGEIIKRKEWPNLSYEQLEKYLNSFRGSFQQIPPKLSSVHIEGEKAYKKFFRNEKFELPSKKVSISELILKNWDQNDGKIKLEISCSSGTYIRSLARDLGSLLNSVGCLYELQRTSSSGFNKKNTNCLDLNKIPANLNKLVIPTINALNHIPEYVLTSKEDLIYWETGRKINIKSINVPLNEDIQQTKTIKVVNKKNQLLGIGLRIDKELIYLQPKLVLNAR